MPARSKQIIARPTSNESVREFHVVGARVSELPYAEFWHPMHGSEEQFSALGPKGKEVAGSLMAQRHEKSISRITFRPESIRIYKTPTADWSTVENEIVIPTLKRVFGNEFQPVQYGPMLQREFALA